MDFNILSEYIVFVVMLGCLVVGYIIKHSSIFKWIKNDNIPAILAVVGLILNLFVSGFSIESAIYGAAMGLMSTGAHQAFKKFVENKTEEVTAENKAE